MSAITITFGECAENHVGMQQLGHKESVGFTLDDFKMFQEECELWGYDTELVVLHEHIDVDVEPAYVLVIRNGYDYLQTDELRQDIQVFKDSLAALDWDKKAMMRGRVVNKRARYNLCFADETQDPDYEAGKGRVVSFKDVPILDDLRENLWVIFGEKARKLYAEGNLYYDISKCGIGYHGDSERIKVVAFRFGEPMPLYYQWYHRFAPIGDPIRIDLNDGDVYLMSEKATGHDWKKSSKYTLRHATGCSKYTTVHRK